MSGGIPRYSKTLGPSAVANLSITMVFEPIQSMPYQALDEELKGLAQKYGPPVGRTMLVFGEGGVVAGGAYRRLSDTDCELKRLFVTDGARGHSLGRKLSDALIGAAIADGYATMKLDTGNRLTEAISMYESMGFAHIDPYQEYPEQLMPYLVFMERPLI
jgi:GNAT superfamily N-acetyltransferase